MADELIPKKRLFNRHIHTHCEGGAAVADAFLISTDKKLKFRRA